MGIDSGLSGTFNMNGTLTPSNVATIEIDGIYISRRVDHWISQDPVALINEIAHRKIHLARNAYHRLLAELQKHHPSIYNQYVCDKKKQLLHKYYKSKYEKLGRFKSSRPLV